MADDEGNEVIKVDIVGENLGEFIGYQGKTLEALQHIMNLTINRDQEVNYKVIVDINQYRKKREEYLISVAQRAMADAIESNQPVYLPPMKAYERRVIHITLKKEENISTSSEGEEPERFIIITPL